MPTIHDIEKHSLGPARWANLFMGCAGIAAALVSNASALMLDGLFSGINFIAAIFAAKVATSIQRRPDALRPFGYEIDESVYVMFRALVLTGIILVAAFYAIAKIVTFATGGDLPPVKLDWVVAYMVLMVIICFALAAWHHANWKKTGGRSDLLKTERQGATLDGILSLAAGAAFLGIALLRNTPLAFLVPISDAIVVLGLSAYMISQPMSMFSQAIKEVVGESADPRLMEKLHVSLNALLADKPFALLNLAGAKTGRALFAIAHIRPEQAATDVELDTIRDEAAAACASVLEGMPLRLEVLFTARHPYD